ncbi:hypothetical protein JAAN108728_00395 [Janibacter anophelis]
MLLDALGQQEGHAAHGRLLEALGGAPVAIDERLVGEPAHTARRLRFASGAEVFLRDATVASVILHTRPTPFAPRGVDLRAWLPGTSDDATLDEIAKGVHARPRFGGPYAYFAREERFVRCRFEGRWSEPGHLVELAVTLAEPGRACQPDDDFCGTCGDLLVRADGVDGVDGVDVDATVDALTAARDAQLLREGRSVVPLADLRLLHSSGLMERVESHLECTSCRRTTCLTLYRDAPPTCVHLTFDAAMRRPLEAIPPVEQWGDAARIAAAADAMRYVDHHPGSWFLAEHESGWYLQSRYSRGPMVDGSCLIRLEASEVEGYRTGGREYLTLLARQIDESRPWTDESPFGRRHLALADEPGAASLRARFEEAIANHRWIAQQRQAQHRRLAPPG